MAGESTSRELKLSSLLCFTVAKFDKLDVKYIKDIICDFYSAGDISSAKKLLLEDTRRLKLDSTLSRYPDRHGDGRTSREIDDIVAVIQQLDESTFLHYLPIYVTDNPDKVPSAKLDDGDMRIIMNKFGKLEATVQSLQSAVHNVSSTVNKLDINSRSAVGNTARDVDWPSLPQPRRGSIPVAPDRRHRIPPIDRTSSVTDTSNIGQSKQAINSQGGKSWSEQVDQVAASGSGTIDDGNYGNHGDSDGFTLVKSRKRGRMGSPGSHEGANAEDNAVNNAQHRGSVDTVPSSVKPSTSTRKPLMVGKRPMLITSSATNRLVAAKPLKLVLCVDNVALDQTERDLQEFVTSIGVRVLSCFKVKPRLSVWERINKITPNHSTFRLCINRADRNQLLNSDLWPEDIVITHYFFKSSIQDANTVER